VFLAVAPLPKKTSNPRAAQAEKLLLASITQLKVAEDKLTPAKTVHFTRYALARLRSSATNGLGWYLVSLPYFCGAAR